MSFFRFLYVCLPLCLKVLLSCSAIELEEIRPRSLHGVTSEKWLGKRDNSVFDLRNQETFLWGAEDGTDATLGNLTVQMPGDTENILAMEKFDGLLKSVKCEDDSLTLTFEDDAAFACAQKVWDWVNGADNHNFLMVAGKGDCGDNPSRIPYLVSKLHYDEAGNVARLDAKKGTWKELIHSYELRVGQLPLSEEFGLSRRDYTRDASFNLHTDFRTKVKVKTGNVFGEFNCNPCGTDGSIKFEFIAKTKYLVPVDLVFKMYPENVNAEFILNFEFVSDFGTSSKPTDKVTGLEKRWTLGKIPLAGVAIPGDILTLGPVIDFQVGIEYAGEMGLKLSTGGKASLPNSAIVEADLLHPENNKFSGWVPQFDAQPLKLEGRVSAKIKPYIEPTLQLEGEAIGFGFGTGLRLQMPYLEVKADYNLSPGGGACHNGDEYQQAVRARLSWGYELKFTAGKINGEQNVDLTLGSSSRTIVDNVCIAEWDKFVPGQKPELPASSTSPTSGPGSTPPNTCTANGKTGTCIDKSTCKGTTSTGNCPNDPDDVLCCTDADATPPPPNTCTANGKSGTCIDKSTCKGTTTTGNCPNDPDNILCCTDADATPPPPNKCTANGKSGTCIDKSTCKGTTTTGNCPNDPDNILCCTEAESTPSPPSPSGGGGGGGCRKFKRDYMGRRRVIPC